MRRLCERPGCSQPADVVYRIEPDQLSVWLARVDAVEGESPNVVCRRHADAMIVPLGWSLDDQRESTPRLFRPAEPVAVVTAVPARRPPLRRNLSVDGSTQLEFGDDTTEPWPEPAAESAEPAERAGQAGWQPVFDQADDLGGLLRAESPLLARAFGGRSRDPKRT